VTINMHHRIEPTTIRLTERTKWRQLKLLTDWVFFCSSGVRFCYKWRALNTEKRH
jgi:hypothetical protein